jgi:hypothetical protein
MLEVLSLLCNSTNVEGEKLKRRENQKNMSFGTGIDKSKYLFWNPNLEIFRKIENLESKK